MTPFISIARSGFVKSRKAYIKKNSLVFGLIGSGFLQSCGQYGAQYVKGSDADALAHVKAADLVDYFPNKWLPEVSDKVVNLLEAADHATRKEILDGYTNEELEDIGYTVFCKAVTKGNVEVMEMVLDKLLDLTKKKHPGDPYAQKIVIDLYKDLVLLHVTVPNMVKEFLNILWAKYTNDELNFFDIKQLVGFLASSGDDETMQLFGSF
ncbi:MAG: hypothetical protein K2X94_02130 [Amoebophilaceae bacterium]|nr:hypothetical protein [Amoebophilaceae bacterium]